MNLEQITPVILTYNEEDNIERSLAKLTWACEILVMDSFSTDRTRGILKSHPRVRVLERHFDTHATQWNAAITDPGIKTSWVLAMDADYVLTDELVAELSMLKAPDEISGLRVSFTYCIDGKPLWGSLYPPSIVLFRRDRGSYVQDGHTQRLRIEGAVAELSGRIRHDDRKPFSRWLASQRKYAVLEAGKLRTAGFATLSWPDRARKLIVIAPWLTPLYCLFWKGCLFQGRPGLYYTYQRTVAEAIVALTLLGAVHDVRKP